MVWTRPGWCGSMAAVTETAVPYFQLSITELRAKLAKNQAMWRHYVSPLNAPSYALASLYAAKVEAIVDELNNRDRQGDTDGLA